LHLFDILLAQAEKSIAPKCKLDYQIVLALNQRRYMSAEPKNQHYVPQFLLKNFSYDAKFVHVFDKHEPRQFKANIRNVASENYFYELSIDDSIISLENYVTEIEDATAPLFKTIIEQNSLAFLSESDRVTISTFVWLQMSRTREAREQVDSFSRHLEEVTNRRFGIDVRELKPEQIADVGYSKNKSETDKIMLNQILAGQQLAKHIFDKHWMLSCNKSPTPLWISDHPVTLESLYGSHRSLGIASEGVQINIPLTPFLNLSFVCKATINKVRLIGEQYLLEKILIQNPTPTSEKDTLIKKFLSNVFEKQVVELEESNVVHLNHLQVRSSYRYIYSREDDFNLAKEMISTFDVFKFGRRIVMED
jgi:Protein of unknown function (DUF4238)